MVGEPRSVYSVLGDSLGCVSVVVFHLGGFQQALRVIGVKASMQRDSPLE
jgi:hypothetical protein